MIRIYDRRDATAYTFIFPEQWGDKIGMWYGGRRDLIEWEDIVSDIARTFYRGEAEIREINSQKDQHFLIRILFEYLK